MNKPDKLNLGEIAKFMTLLIENMSFAWRDGLKAPVELSQNDMTAFLAFLVAQVPRADGDPLLADIISHDNQLCNRVRNAVRTIEQRMD
jgi:hypothetical protein